MEIGFHLTGRVPPTGPRLEAMRSGNFDVVLKANCHGAVNPAMDVQGALSPTVDRENLRELSGPKKEIDLYDKMLRETDLAKQRARMYDFKKHAMDEQAHEIWVLWVCRIVPYRWYVKGRKISPSHLINQDLATIRQIENSLERWICIRASFRDGPLGQARNPGTLTGPNGRRPAIFGPRARAAHVLGPATGRAHRPRPGMTVRTNGLSESRD